MVISSRIYSTSLIAVVKRFARLTDKLFLARLPMRNSQPRPVHLIHFCSGSSSSNSSRKSHSWVGPEAAADSFARIDSSFGASDFVTSLLLVGRAPTLCDRSPRFCKRPRSFLISSSGVGSNWGSDMARSRAFAPFKNGPKTSSGSVFIWKETVSFQYKTYWSFWCHVNSSMT